MKTLPFALLLLSCTAAAAASPEDAYLTARDHDIAALAKFANAPDPSKGDALTEKALAGLGRRMKQIIGQVAVPGFPTDGKLNLESLSPQDQGYGMLDGLAYGGPDNDKTLVVSTPRLLEKWLAARQKDAKESELPHDLAGALRSGLFYTWAVNSDAAAMHYGEILVTTPPGATFATAMLSARSQDMSPTAPDEIFVTLETADRFFIVEEKLTTPMKPIAACDAVTADYAKRSEAADKAYVAGHKDDAKLADRGIALRDEGDVAFRACYADKVKDTPAFKAAAAQAAAVLSALAKAQH